LSDQQWVRHWLIYIDSDENEGIVTTDQPIGFDLSGDPDWPDERPPERVELEASPRLDFCAGNFAEFLYRFWVENELFFALTGERPLAGAIKDYAEDLIAKGQAT
jgi:hypothetical protein